MRYKTIYKSVLIAITMVIMLYSCFQISIPISNGYRNEIEFFDKPNPISDAICYYKDDKFIYECSPKSSIVQIFSQNGDFLKGILLPSQGGAVWVGTSSKKELYIYCVRSDYQLLIDDEQCSVEKNIQYINPEEFYKQNNITNENLCRMKGLYVSYSRNSIEHSVKLNASKNYLTSDVCIVIIILCINVVLLLTGAFKKLLGEAVDNIDKKRDPYARLKRK